jgi:hypothetical protein
MMAERLVAEDNYETATKRDFGASGITSASVIGGKAGRGSPIR